MNSIQMNDNVFVVGTDLKYYCDSILGENSRKDQQNYIEQVRKEIFYWLNSKIFLG